MIWVRVGDSDNYHSLDTIEEAARYVESRLSNWDGDAIWLRPGGVTLVPHFQGRNYVSCYWGNRDANLVRYLNEAEKATFEDELRRVYYKETE